MENYYENYRPKIAEKKIRELLQPYLEILKGYNKIAPDLAKLELCSDKQIFTRAIKNLSKQREKFEDLEKKLIKIHSLVHI